MLRKKGRVVDVEGRWDLRHCHYWTRLEACAICCLELKCPTCCMLFLKWTAFTGKNGETFPEINCIRSPVFGVDWSTPSEEEVKKKGLLGEQELLFYQSLGEREGNMLSLSPSDK